MASCRSGGSAIKALRYKGAFSVAVEDVPDATIKTTTDAVIKITTTNICGSDLHMYEGRTNVEEDKILGHENMGVVAKVGPGVQFVKVGDRVSVPFNIGCGNCQNCQQGWTSFCTQMNPTEGMDGAAYGYASMGPYDGGQAEYLRVPFADFNLLQLPAGNDWENDFTMLSDIFPTAYHGCVLGEVGPGHSVAVFGGGPVGLLAAHSAFLRGASRVFLVDQHADRLQLAKAFGAEAIDFSVGDAVWSGCTCPRTRGRPTRAPRRAGSPSTTARSSQRASAWAPARRRSSGTTGSFAT